MTVNLCFSLFYNGSRKIRKCFISAPENIFSWSTNGNNFHIEALSTKNRIAQVVLEPGEKGKWSSICKPGLLWIYLLFIDTLKMLTVGFFPSFKC